MVDLATYHREQFVTLLQEAGFVHLSNTDLFTHYLNLAIY